jgi:hypothetical protein
VATFTAIRPYPVSHFYRFTAFTQFFKARESSQVKSGSLSESAVKAARAAAVERAEAAAARAAGARAAAATELHSRSAV